MLLHDLDFEEVKDLENHGKKTIEILKEQGFPEDMIHAIASHNEIGTGVMRENRFDYALAASDNISGLIYAYALIRKSISGIEVKKIKKRIKEKAFAANCDREKIRDIEKGDIEIDLFLGFNAKFRLDLPERPDAISHLCPPRTEVPQKSNK